MAKPNRKRKCKHCHIFFPPDPRNARHQKYCSQPECRKISKAASQTLWLHKEENRGYFRGPENVRRVQEWRKTNPGYWRRKTCREPEPLQDPLSEKPAENPWVEGTLPKPPLQDLLSSQHIVLIGLIAQLTGTALQDDIVLATRRLQQLGNDILNHPTRYQGGNYDRQTPHLWRPSASRAQAVQLGGSPAGP